MLNCNAEREPGTTHNECSGVIYLACSYNVSLIVLALVGAELSYNDLGDFHADKDSIVGNNR